MTQTKAVHHHESLESLVSLSAQMNEQVSLLRTMAVRPGSVEPIDCTGCDLCGRVREMSFLCAKLQKELLHLEKSLVNKHV